MRSDELAYTLFVGGEQSARRDADNLTSELEVYLEGYIHTLTLQVDKLTAGVQDIYLMAELYYTRAAFHNQTGFIALFANIIACIKWFGKVLTSIATAMQIIKEIGLHDWLYDNWGRYREVVDQVSAKLSQYSDALGWGVHGVQAILHISQSGNNILGAALGKDEGMLELEFFDKIGPYMESLDSYIRQGGQNAGLWIEAIANLGQTGIFGDMKWEFGKWKRGLDIAIERTLVITDEMTNITGELLGLQEGMPEFIRQHIPQSIWTAIGQADSYLNNKILPGLERLDSTVKVLNDRLEDHNNKLSDLAQRLTRPGLIFAELDGQPDHIREHDEGIIGDVASRELDRQVDETLEGMYGDLQAFDKISEALSAPTPQPSFMNLEGPGAKQFGEITAEPQETWMVGGYESPY